VPALRIASHRPTSPLARRWPSNPSSRPLHQRVGYVPEHFSSPLLQLAKEDGGKTFVVVPCPAGTGQMIQRLTDDEIDVSMCVPRKEGPLSAMVAHGPLTVTTPSCFSAAL
jgi:hypothetical protein